MKIKWKTLFISIAIPLLVGLLSSLLTFSNMSTFQTINKPPGSLPAYLFPIVWTILYVFMGIASYLVYTSHYYNRYNVLFIYELQLIFNFFWSIIFFNYQAYLFAFVWLVILWILVLITTIQFYKINKFAGILMIPYLLWITFAGYLNFMIYLLN